MDIRKTTEADLPAIQRLHLAAFEGGFMLSRRAKMKQLKDQLDLVESSLELLQKVARRVN